jgi:hypothetical protein
MKRTILTILITCLVTSLGWHFVGSLRRGIEGLWLMSAIKAPGRMALDSIEADLEAGRLEIAKRKLAALRKQWSVFESEAGFRGEAIGNIMVAFSQIDIAAETNKIAEPGGAANRGQPVGSETNRTSGAAGPGG